MDHLFWYERWQRGEIGFHMGRPHHDLVNFFERLDLSPGEQVLVPMCGKSQDLLWLHERGVEVLGVELSELAVQAFFTENDLTMQRDRVTDFSRFRSVGLELLCGDFFRMRPEQTKRVRAVFDRAALVALPPALRRHYADRLLHLLTPGSRVLLVSYDYDQDELAGPPFSVPIAELEVLFGAGFKIEKLVARDALATHDVLRQRGLTRLTEFCCLLERKGR